jgi:hypothetical protein
MRERLQSPEAVAAFIRGLHRIFADVGLLVRPSGSHGIMRPDGTLYKDSKNWHVYMFIDGDRAVAYDRIKALMAVQRMGWIFVSTAGSLLERSPVDIALRMPNQLTFAAPPTLRDGLKADRPAPHISEGRALLVSDIPSGLEEAAEHYWADLKNEPGTLLLQAQVKNQYVKTKAREKLPPRAPRQLMRKVLEGEKHQRVLREMAEAERGVLEQDFVVHLHPSGSATVAEILSNPKRYHKHMTKDPLEPDYRGGSRAGMLSPTAHRCLSATPTASRLRTGWWAPVTK